MNDDPFVDPPSNALDPRGTSGVGQNVFDYQEYTSNNDVQVDLEALKAGQAIPDHLKQAIFGPKAHIGSNDAQNSHQAFVENFEASYGGPQGYLDYSKYETNNQAHPFNPNASPFYMPNAQGPSMSQGYGQYPMQYQTSFGASHSSSYQETAVQPNNTVGQAQDKQPSATSMFTIRSPPPMPPIAVTKYAIYDEDGKPELPPVLIERNDEVGVVHITGNPYNTGANEVLVLIGDKPVVMEYPVGSGIFGVHIIQDRMSGKTQDIFLELTTLEEAQSVMRRYDVQQHRSRPPKLGTRRPRFALSDSQLIMKTIFPRAKCEWVNGLPVRTAEYVANHGSNWDGFITMEELVKVMLFSDCIYGSKTRFASECPERVYQFMMSSLAKIPWDADQEFFPKFWIHKLHEVLQKMAVTLARHVVARTHHNMSTKLLTQFMTTLKCCPMYGNGAEKSIRMYMAIAESVDYIMECAYGIMPAPPLPVHRSIASTPTRRGTDVSPARSDLRNTPVRRATTDAANQAAFNSNRGVIRGQMSSMTNADTQALTEGLRNLSVVGTPTKVNHARRMSVIQAGSFSAPTHFRVGRMTNPEAGPSAPPIHFGTNGMNDNNRPGALETASRFGSANGTNGTNDSSQLRLIDMTSRFGAISSNDNQQPGVLNTAFRFGGNSSNHNNHNSHNRAFALPTSSAFI